MNRLLLCAMVSGVLTSSPLESSCGLVVDVVDAETGASLSKAAVSLTEYRRGDRLLAEEVTSADGSARFTKDLDTGQYSVWASYPGFESTSREVVCKAEAIQITIPLRENAAVSLVELIANPVHWDGRKVAVAGFLNLEFEGDALYFHKTDWKKHIYGNSVWVHRSPDMREKYKSLNRHYVTIVGVFDGKDRGAMGLFQGAIRDISSCEILR